MTPPRLSVVLLTWNEAANIRDCLAGLAAQRCRDFEVVVVDAASTDGTPGIVAEAARGFPVPLRLEHAATRISVGAARNLGASLARADAVAFLSADAVPEPGWVEEALRGLEHADLVYGLQRHAPTERERGVGAAVRGLRYHAFERPPEDPAAMASHANAAVRAGVLRAFPMGSGRAASAVDDLLLARRAVRAGWRAAYNPRMVVGHRDVASARAELRKNLREGLGWGAFPRELGLHRSALAWAGLLAGAGTLAALASPAAGLAALAAVLWAPAARRAWRGRGRMAPAPLLVGAAASPVFDLAFLAAYLRGLGTGLHAGWRRPDRSLEDLP